MKERMMHDYDYHRHTGELPEYFGDEWRRWESPRRHHMPVGPNNGCLYLMIIAVIVSIVALAIVKWGVPATADKSSAKPADFSWLEFRNTATDSTAMPPVLPGDPSPSPTPVDDASSSPSTTSPTATTPSPAHNTLMSSAYEEGYETGYDDGEADAADGDEWQASFDDECHYRGKKRHEYQTGYEEGYEAGYYDVTDGEE